MLGKNLVAAGLSSLAFAILLSCTASCIERAGWEGIRGDTLRVFVTLDIPEEISPAAVPERMTAPLLEAGRKRAALLLSAYVRELFSDLSRIDSSVEAMYRAAGSAVIADRECDEEACSAVIDVPIREILEAARGPSAQ